MGIRVEAAAYNNIGGRKNNEDNFYLNGESMRREQMDRGGRLKLRSGDALQIYGVFDGMGGAEFGEEASCFAAGRLKEYQKHSEHADNAENLRAFLTDASMGIDGISARHALKSGACGSTAALLVLGDWWYRTATVGDSRVYLCRGGEIQRITRDQSAVQRMVERGEITLDEAWSHPRKNVITHYLGMPLKTPQIQAEISGRTPMQAGDCFLICSDGINDALRDSEILEELQPGRAPEECAAALVRRAVRSSSERGIQPDNATAVVVRVARVAPEDADRRRVRRLCVRRALLGALSIALALCACASIYLFMTV